MKEQCSCCGSRPGGCVDCIKPMPQARLTTYNKRPSILALAWGCFSTDMVVLEAIKVVADTPGGTQTALQRAWRLDEGGRRTYWFKTIQAAMEVAIEVERAARPLLHGEWTQDAEPLVINRIIG